MSEPTKGNTRSLGRVFSDLIVFFSFSAIVVCLLMTVGDIVLRIASTTAEMLTGERPKWGLLGLVDLTQLAVMTAAPLAIAATFFNQAHIRIDIIFNIMGLFGKRLSMIVSAALGVFLMAICLWTAWNEMRGQLDFTTTSATLAIPYTWYWAPLILGLALSLIACGVSLIIAIGKPLPDELEQKNA